MAVLAKQNSIAHTLHDPHDLTMNDQITFGAIPQKELSEHSFHISAINTYDFDGDATTVFTLHSSNGSSDNNEEFHMTVIGTTEPYLCLAKSISDDILPKLFDMNEVEELMDSGSGIILERLNTMPTLKNWTAESYALLEENNKVTIHAGDFRNKTLPMTNYDNECSYYLLEDSSSTFAIEIENHHDNLTVYAAAYHSLDVIKKMSRP